MISCRLWRIQPWVLQCDYNCIDIWHATPNFSVCHKTLRSLHHFIGGRKQMRQCEEHKSPSQRLMILEKLVMSECRRDLQRLHPMAYILHQEWTLLPSVGVFQEDFAFGKELLYLVLLLPVHTWENWWIIIFSIPYVFFDSLLPVWAWLKQILTESTLLQKQIFLHLCILLAS